MEVIQAIEERRSTRVFKPVPVPRELVNRLLSLAIKAPSANNLQPWEFTVVAGDERARLSRTLIKAYHEKQISCGSGTVKPLPEVFRRRGGDTLEAMRPYLEATGLPLSRFIDEGSLDFYGAPVAIIMSLDDCFSDRQMVDTGAALGYLVLAAHGRGLGTCPVGLICAYQDEAKDLLNIPQNKKIVIGVALGYPDTESPANRFRSSRDEVAKFVRWVE